VHTNSRFTDYINSIDVDAPMLKQLTLSFSTAGHKFSVSIVAPILENVSWGCFYPIVTVGFGPWGLSRIMLCVPERHHGRQRVITEEEDGCLRQLSNAYVMTLIISSRTLFEFPDEGYNLMHTIEKHFVTDFSVLELYFRSWLPRYTATSLKHVFGAFVLHLLGVCRIRNAIQRLKIVLHRLPVKEECPVNCPCDEPKNWRSENISLINLEQVETHGFDGDDHEFDFLKVIFRCAPVLKRMVVWVLAEVAASNDRCTEIHDIFKAYPFVDCRLMEH